MSGYAAMEISAMRVWYNGAWIVQASYGNYTTAITYFGYTKKEAIARFREEIARRRFAK